MTQPASNPTPAETAPTIGTPGEPVRALVFSGGGYDTVMQLGAVHALLVSRSAAPHTVVGVSAGAINAVALAEVLQAGGGQDTPEGTRLEARVARFREILEAYRSAPDDVGASLLPDIYQVDSRAPLVPTDLPIHKPDERGHRRSAATARKGLIDFINDLLDIRVSMGSMARLARAWLGIKALPEVRPWWKRAIAGIRESWRITKVLAVNLRSLTPLVARLIEITLSDKLHRFGNFIGSTRFATWALKWTTRFNAPMRLAGWIAALMERLAPLISDRYGRTAGFLMFRGRVRRAGRWAWTTFIGGGAVIGVPATALVTILAIVTTQNDSLLTLVVRLHDVVLRYAWAERLLHLIVPYGVAAIGIAAGVLGLLLIRAWRMMDPERLLAFYGIRDGLFDPHPLRSWLVRLFDPAFYGPTNIASVVEVALSDGRAGVQAGARTATSTSSKPIKRYQSQSPSIHVGPMAADLEQGRLNVLAGETSVVDSLLAAMARPPLFEARHVGGGWYVDGAAVANEPIRALIGHLRRTVHDDATIVHVYPVSPLPARARAGDGKASRTYGGVIETVLRGRELERLRDATLDRRMANLVSESLPPGGATWWPKRNPDGLASAPPPADQKIVRVTVHEADFELAVSINERILTSNSVADRRRIVAEGVADGCRAMMETLFHHQLLDQPATALPCAEAVESRVPGPARVPGTGGAGGPGLPEVCGECALNRCATDDRKKRRVMLAKPAARRSLPQWPLEIEEGARAGVRRRTRASPRVQLLSPKERPWPLPRAGDGGLLAGDARPTVSLLFSGGVFRGVYLVGVLNALNEMGVVPDLVAGSSIGSITAAMAARTFAFSKDAVAARRERVVRLAATYLAVDRLVLTDRFSDFVRNVTLRAAATESSPRDFDTVFRAFDRLGTDEYGNEFRRVLAGLERLFWISPFEARDLVHAFRMREYARVHDLIARYAQEWLERGAVGLEILGAEPLELLIRQHVLDGYDGSSVGAERALADDLAAAGLQFIATATNITTAQLDSLHFPRIEKDRHNPRFIELLLASSAFPAVFRPRWTWEVSPGTAAVEQYIDGGVMDNLPLDAVARFLNNSRLARRLAARPRVGGADVPHLLFTASLECERGPITDAREARDIAKSWRRAGRRVKELSYNRKIEGYAKAQTLMRTARKHWPPGTKGRFEPMDLEVITVRPKWLCGTFAFHPMLGFRRKDQAASIAHGCRTTFAKLAAVNSTNPNWMRGWGLRPGRVSTTADDKAGAGGGCWYRKGEPCPFSRAAIGHSLPPHTCKALDRIHMLCREKSTHDPR